MFVEIARLHGERITITAIALDRFRTVALLKSHSVPKSFAAPIPIGVSGSTSA
jgi:hypothetical protein